MPGIVIPGKAFGGSSLSVGPVMESGTDLSKTDNTLGIEITSSGQNNR